MDRPYAEREYEMFMRSALLGILLAGLSGQAFADISAQSTNDDFDVYDYPQPDDDNWVIWDYRLMPESFGSRTSRRHT